MLLAAALAVGALVGFISGLTGIGGGVLMVPFLYVLYGKLGLAADQATPLAHATSLAVIVPAALTGLAGYRGTGLVRWRSALPLAAAAALSAGLTAPVAARLPASALRIGFSLFLITVATDLLLRRESVEQPPSESRAHLAGAALLGLPVGALSAALGVGGGLPATMGMHYLLRLPFRFVAPTSLAVIAIIAAAGSISYTLLPSVALPFGPVIGRVDLAHGLPLALGAVLFSPLGVYVNQRAPVLVLRRVFGALLVSVAAKLMVDNL